MYGVSTDANGLYYMRQRYYNTEIKRFINQDIVSGNMENSQSLNRYSYVQGNPVTLTDPFGLSPENGGNALTSFVHGILDLAGCVPGGVGVAANLANAALYAIVDHDYGMAALSLLAGVTMGATKIVSMGGKLAKAAKTVETVGKMISNTATFAMCAVQTVKTGSAMWQKYHEKGAEFNGETAMELLTIGLNAAGMVMSGKGMVESGNKLCKTVKESGVTHKIAGKVKQTATAIKNDNRGIVDFDAPVLGRKSGSGSVQANKADFIVTPKGMVMDTSKDYNLVSTTTPTNQGREFFQIHNNHPHRGNIPHTHKQQVNTNPVTGVSSSKRVDNPTTAADIDYADNALRVGTLRIRINIDDVGGY